MAQLASSSIFQEIQKGITLNSEITFQSYKEWYELKIEKRGRSKATLQKYLQNEQKNRWVFRFTFERYQLLCFIRNG